MHRQSAVARTNGLSPLSGACEKAIAPVFKLRCVKGDTTATPVRADDLAEPNRGNVSSSYAQSILESNGVLLLFQFFATCAPEFYFWKSS